MFDNINVLSLVKVGFHGVAVVMLYMGYKLIKATKDVSSDMFKQQCKQARFFLIIALAFLIIGPGLQIVSDAISPENEIHLNFYPEKLVSANQPDIKLGSAKFSLFNGSTSFAVREDDSILISLEKINDKILGLLRTDTARQGDVSDFIGEEND